MPKIYVGIGSSVEPEHHIRAAMQRLTQQFAPVEASPLYESEAVGFEGDNFLNFVVSFDSTLGLDEIIATLKNIEDQLGRDRSQPRYSSRTIDLDLLLYGAQVLDGEPLVLPRDEITRNAYVLRPLAELAPELIHPRLGQTMAELWQHFDASQQGLWPVTFDWQTTTETP